MMISEADHSIQQATRGKDEDVNHRLVTILAGEKSYGTQSTVVDEDFC